MASHIISNEGFLTIHTPAPSILYGYKPYGAFSKQLDQIMVIGPETFTNRQGLMYPFVNIKFAGESPGYAERLYIATNHCLAAAASCMYPNECLRHAGLEGAAQRRLQRRHERHRGQAVHHVEGRRPLPHARLLRGQAAGLQGASNGFQ
jgi:hypothetical protein